LHSNEIDTDANTCLVKGANHFVLPYSPVLVEKAVTVRPVFQ